MIEPTRNDVCKNMPANTACEGFRLDNPADERIHLDAVRSAALIDSVRRGAREGVNTNWGALNGVVRLTCWT